MSSELSCVVLLTDYGLIPSEKLCNCGTSMNLREKRGDRIFVVWRCNKSNWKTKHSVLSEFCFLAFKGLDAKLRSSCSLREIMEIVYLFLNTSPTKVELRENTERSSSTIMDWCSQCREVCTHSIENSPKLIGTSEALVQIDRSSFVDRRK